MKYFYLFVYFVFCSLFSYSQSQKWEHYLDISFTKPRKDEFIYGYTYFKENGDPVKVLFKLKEQNVWKLDYNIEYNFFRKFNAIATTGVANIGGIDALALKLGLGLRYTFIKDYKASTYAKISYLVGFSDRFSSGTDAIWGVTIPFYEEDDYYLYFGLHYNYVSMGIKKPLFSFEKPESVHIRGAGFSFGISF